MATTAWAKRNNVTRQEQVDEYFISEIDKVKDHPALLCWYVCDERPATEIPDRTHSGKNGFPSTMQRLCPSIHTRRSGIQSLDDGLFCRLNSINLIHAQPCKALRRYIGHQNICARKR